VYQLTKVRLPLGYLRFEDSAQFSVVSRNTAERQRLARRGISTLHTDFQAFTLSGRPLEQGGRRLRRASGKAESIGQERTETEAEHDLLDHGVVVDKQRPVVPRLGEEAGTNVRCLVEEDLAEQGRWGNTEVLRPPAAADFLRIPIDWEDADLPRHQPKEGGQARSMHPLTQR